VLVFALDLEDVEEVGACGVDFDEVFVRCWGGGGQVGYFEVEGALHMYICFSDCSGCSNVKMRVYLDIFAELDGAHCVYTLRVNDKIVLVCSDRRQSLLEIVVDNQKVDSGDSSGSWR
jgi:hypothetical protein